MADTTTTETAREMFAKSLAKPTDPAAIMRNHIRAGNWSAVRYWAKEAAKAERRAWYRDIAARGK